jgi:hypothetical protein
VLWFGGGAYYRSDGVSVFCGSENLLLFGDLWQGGAPLGGEAKTFRWVYTVGG